MSDRGSVCLVPPIEHNVAACWSNATRSQLASPARASPLLDSKSAAFRATLDVLAKAARARAPVMILGESGSGKGVLAEWVHSQSLRADGPFVAVNCPALPEELLTAELFGYTRGAFTGAIRDKPGRVESAHAGSLFLDEIGDLPSALQVKLLRFLQDGSFERLGELKSRRADVRVIAATSRDPEADVQSGRLRLDLYYRLNVVEVVLPPLRDRPEDVLDLARHLLGEVAAESNRAVPDLSADACTLLCGHRWPGNIRELRNELERAMAIHPGRILDATCFSHRLSVAHSHVAYLGGDFSIAQIERLHIERVIDRTRSLEEAARILDIDDSTLWRKRKRFATSRHPRDR